MHLRFSIRHAPVRSLSFLVPLLLVSLAWAEDPPLEPIPLPQPQSASRVVAPAIPPASIQEADTPYRISQEAMEVPVEPTLPVIPQVVEPTVPAVAPHAPSETVLITPAPQAASASRAIVRRTIYVVDPRCGIVRPVTIVSVTHQPVVAIVPSIPGVAYSAVIPASRVHETARVASPGEVLVAPDAIVVDLGPLYVPGQPLRNAIRRRAFP